MVVQARNFKRLSDKKVICQVCNRYCVIEDGKHGWCQTRENRGGNLFSLIYGKVSTMMISPAEKKPFFHFLPGSMWLSLGSLGCNFRCPGCQNWDISHAKVSSKAGNFIPPERLIDCATREKCDGISWTYNEPTLWFEYTLDCAKLAKQRGLFTNYVTNGFITSEALNEIGEFLDVFRVDIKGFSKTTYRRVANISNFERILDSVVCAKNRWGMHVEIITNVIPTYNDWEGELRDIARWIKKSLGEYTPWHITRFYPHLYLSHLYPTPIKKLERGREIGLEEGLFYVYIGNVPGHFAENTYCHNCKTELILRYNIYIKENRILNGMCPRCRSVIPGKF